MEKSTQMGVNRTGVDASPILSKEMAKGSEKYTPASAPNGDAMDDIERQYIEESESIGSVPVPGTISGALKAAMKKMTGRNPEMLLNKLGERLAFERSGVRLYDSFILKNQTLASVEGFSPVSMDELQHIRDEEAEHFQLLKESIEAMGADPTAQTPDADVSGVASRGIQQVLNDPRTTISQGLEMLLTLELSDNAAWDLLIKLTDEMGLDEMSAQFQRALEQEDEHLAMVRSWYEQSVLAQGAMGAPH